MTRPPKTPNALLHGALDGYAIARSIEDTTDNTVVVEEGSPDWGTSELGRRAKLYRITYARGGRG